MISFLTVFLYFQTAAEAGTVVFTIINSLWSFIVICNHERSKTFFTHF